MALQVAVTTTRILPVLFDTGSSSRGPVSVPGTFPLYHLLRPDAYY